MPNPRPVGTLKAPGEQLPDYILAKSKLRGVPTRAAVHGRRYMFLEFDNEYYIHKDDVAAHPEWFEAVTAAPVTTPARSTPVTTIGKAKSSESGNDSP